MITVLHTESSLGLGGQEKRILRELELIDRSRFRPLYLCQPGAKSIAPAEALDVPVSTIRMRNAFNPVTILGIARLLRRERVDVVHTHSSRDAWLTGMAARLAGIPVVRTRHLQTPIGGPFVYARLADRVVTVSGQVREYLVSEGVPADQVLSIPTGIDLQRFDPDRNDLKDIRTEFGIAPDAFVIGIIAVLRKAKGHHHLLAAFARLAADHPRLHLLIAGDGPQWDNLHALAEQLDLGDRVTFTGHRTDVPDILNALNLFVLPSHMEALGTALLEAMAMGVPVVASDVGGIPEAVGEAGVLCAAEDTDGLAAAVQGVVDDDTLRLTLIEQGRHRARELYDQNLMVRRLEDLYESLLGKHQ
jgi:glycosyltransferase involved in cell wall biosynthesis